MKEKELREQLEKILERNLLDFGDIVKMLLEFVDDSDLDDNLRELAGGAILFMLTSHDIIPKKFGETLSLIDDLIIAKFVINEIVGSNEEKGSFYSKKYGKLITEIEKELQIFEQFFGKAVIDWMKSWLNKLQDITYKGKKAKTIIKEVEMAYWIQDEINEKLLDIELNPQIIKQELQQKLDKVNSYLQEKVNLQKYNK